MADRPHAARLGDKHTCPHPDHGGGGCVLPTCAQTVLIGDQNAARIGDILHCEGDADKIIDGEPSVLIANAMAARQGDPTVHGGSICEGCSSVIIGRPYVSSAACRGPACHAAWQRANQEADDLIKMSDPIERAKVFSAKWAQLYQSNKNLFFPGLAAFTAKQVSCGLKDIVLANHVSSALPLPSPFNQILPYAGRRVFDELAKGNAAAFKAGYPPLHVYNKLTTGAPGFGDAGISKADCIAACLASVGAHPNVVEGIRLIANGKPLDGALKLLHHEQSIVLKEMYNDEFVRKAVDANQALGRNNLYISSACTTDIPQYILRFTGSHLWELGERWDFASNAVNYFSRIAVSPIDSLYIDIQHQSFIDAIKH